MESDIQAIHNFWFGELDANGLSSPEHQRLWFTKSNATDSDIRRQYTEILAQASAGRLDNWIHSDAGLVALIVLLDQFSRNIFRDDVRAFDADPKALGFALSAIKAQRHLQLPAIHQVFLYLPLEHCEDLAIQKQCVALFEELALRTGDSRVADFGRYAVAHYDVIARFGRFPHRNSVLGRQSTEEELEYLEKHGGF